MEAAAQGGDINALYVLISQIPDVLEDIDKKSFVETPLHRSASRGYTEFALEIMRLKPSFARKANKDGFPPMHVALHNNKTDTVLGLLDFEVNLVRVKGKEGVTPLHYVAQEERIDLLIRFLSACPKSLEDVTVRKETALHIALKNSKLEAFKVMIRWLEIGCKEILCSEKMILNRKDNQGKTILQLARSRAEAAQVVLFLANSKVGKYLDDPDAVLNMQIDDGQVDGAEPLDAYIHLLRRDQRLKKAAEQGNTHTMYAILGEDPYVLEDIDQVPFIDTPLHVAASAGKAGFAHDILRLKPSFAKKLNRDGYSPLHLALQKNHSETVHMLLAFDKELVHVQGRDGITPLHYASQIGDVQHLLKLIEACPKSIEGQTASGETALQVAVRNDKLNSLKILCGWLQRAGELEILFRKNHSGHTVWNIAKERNNPLVIKVLKDYGAGKNKNCKTLADTVGLKASIFERAAYASYRSRLLISDNHRNILLLVATLILTKTYQAVLSPPSSYDKNFTNANNTETTTFTGNATIFIPADKIYHRSFLAFSTQQRSVFLYLKSFICYHVAVCFCSPSFSSGRFALGLYCSSLDSEAQCMEAFFFSLHFSRGYRRLNSFLVQGYRELGRCCLKSARELRSD